MNGVITHENNLMTVHDVAAYLRLSEATIYRLAKSKKMPAVKIGRTWRFQRRLVEEWIRKEAEILTLGLGPS